MNADSQESGQEQESAGKKILRACVVQGGKVIDEQRFRGRDPLTIGSGPKNTFVVADANLPKTHELFAVRSGKYELVLTEQMRGKLSVAGSESPVDVATLKAQGLLKKRGDLFYLPLSDSHRGKVTINDLTIIFQFVTPPPAPPKPQLPAAARGSLWTRVDKLFLGCWMFVFTFECLFGFYLHLQPKPPEVTLETMDNRWAQLIVPDKKPEVKKIENKNKNESKMKDATKSKEAPEKKEEVAKEEEPKDEAKAKAQAERRAGIRKNIASKGILAVLGTLGEGSSGGAVADVFGQGKLSSDLDSAFQGISGVGIAAGGRTTRGGGSGKAASIGGLATAGGGKVGLGGKAEEKVGTVQTGEAEVDGSLDQGAIVKTVQSRMRSVQDCYERELKRDPSLQGKVEIEFTIGEDGRVQEARVSNNKMGSDAVGECIVSRIRGWRFPKPDGGSVTVNFPFIFAPSS